MKPVRGRRVLMPLVALLGGLFLGGVRGDVAATTTAPAEPGPIAALLAGLTPGASGVAFLTKKTRLWLGRSQVICFYAKDATEEDRFFSFAADEAFVHVLIPPTLAPGTHLGYLRLRPLKEGHTQITLADATIDVDIVRDTAASTLESTRPEIVSPVQGAVVWGKFAVGVERLNLSTSTPPPPPVLRLPDGRELAAETIPDQEPGPHLRYAWTVDAHALRPGTNELVAVAKDSQGHEIVSEPVEVVALEPGPGAILAGDCKDMVKTHWPVPKIPFAYPNNETKPLNPPAVVADDKANLGQVVSVQDDNTPWALTVNIPAKGLYQMMVTARGDIGGNALPTVALGIDGGFNPATMGRLATSQWQRTPVGHPVTLEGGEHVLLVRFRNPFRSVANDNRHLYLARYELARLDQMPAPKLAANDPAATTMDASATPFNQKPQAMIQPGATGAPTMQTGAAGSPAMQANAMQSEASPGEPMMQAKASGGAMMMMQTGPALGSFHVVFRDALEGQVIANSVGINGMCWWPDRGHSTPPTVDLLVNDKVVATLTSPQPRFRVDVSAFQPGKNKIELQGVLPNGQRAHSVAENLVLPPQLAAGDEPFRMAYHFTVYDPAWQGSLRTHINANDPDPIAAFYSNGDATLALPDALEGRYRISVEARGTDYQGPAVATVLLRVNGQETKLGEVPAGAKLATLNVGQTTFAPGPKTLVVRYANDASEKDKGSLFVHSVSVSPVALHPNRTPPVATLLYPAPGAKVGTADAVVVNVLGLHGVVHTDLLIDGQPQHFNLQATNGLGPILFPLLTRTLSPGDHQLQITAKDDAGLTAQSASVNVTVTGQDEPAGAYDRALFLLNRFGYGPEPRELAAILTEGPHAWLDARVNETIDSPAEENEKERLRAEFPDAYSVVPRAVQYLITDGNPVRGRFLVWTENHFSTWVNKDGPAEKSREHDRFLELGIAPFSDLLLASATSPAMLLYLDQRNSVAHHLNENYAREVMELHTLGVKGGYTQKDVTTLADLLTGWTLADEAPLDGSEVLERTFRYNPYLNSGNPCQVLGMEFPGVPLDHRFDRVLTALNMLSAHPSCAYFISRKIAEHYVADPAPPQLVDDLAHTYLESGGDLRVMLLALADEPAFWTAPAKVASPIDFGVRLARLAGMNYPGPVNDLASHSGMGMFDRATPDGYPEEDGYFTSSNALLQRWHFAQTIQANFLNSGLIPNDWKPADNAWDPATTQRLVDLAAVRITGKVLSDASNQSALQLIASAPENTEARLHVLATFVCQVPENSLR